MFGSIINMITPQFHKDECDLSILKEKLWNLINQVVFADRRPNIYMAYALARFCHMDQKRDEGTPYIVHPIRVSLYLMETFQFSDQFFKGQNITKEDALIIALLHDTIEDSGETITRFIEEEFGTYMLKMIQFLTKNNGDNLTVIYYDQLKKAPEIVKVIKLLDRLDNLRGLLNSELKSKERKKDYLSESKNKIIPLLDSGYSSECQNVINSLHTVISFMEESLSSSN